MVQQPLSFWDLVQNKSILITSVVVLLASNALTVLEPTLPTHLEKVFNSTPMLTGLVFMCESLVDIVASPLVGWYSDRVGNKPLMIAGMLLAGLVMVPSPHRCRLRLRLHASPTTQRTPAHRGAAHRVVAAVFGGVGHGGV